LQLNNKIYKAFHLLVEGFYDIVQSIKF
jgi:hypothetical protein